MDGWGSKRAAIAGFIMRTMSNKVDRLHLIFNLNSTTYIDTYIIPTKWIKLPDHLILHTLITNKIPNTDTLPVSLQHTLVVLHAKNLLSSGTNYFLYIPEYKEAISYRGVLVRYATQVDTG